MTANAKQLADWDRQHVWHAFTQMAEYEPFVIERAEGCWLVDIHGRRYLDGVSSLWCNLHGHRHPRIDAAVSEQLDRIAHATLLGVSSVPAIELARRLAQIAPGDLQHAFFSSDGSCAVEAALKIAFQYWRQCDPPRPEKQKYLAFGSAYHGDTIGSTAVGAISRFHSLFEPLLFEPIRVAAPDIRQGDAAAHLARVEEALQRHGDQIAAVVIEPLVQGAAGMVMQPPGFLGGLRALADKHDVLLIADEIVTGFGRTGRMFACEHEGVTPDLLCLGKSLSAGYLPLSATLATPKVHDAFLGPHVSGRAFQHGHTYGGNPLAAAAALASLDILAEERVLEDSLPEKIELLAAAIAPLRAQPHVADVRQRGLLAAVELVEKRTPLTPYADELRMGWQVCQHATRNGVWLRPLGDVVVLVPPLAISVTELAMLGATLRRAIDAVCGGSA